MVEPRVGVLLVVLRADGKQHADILVHLHILLELGIHLSAREILAYLYALGSVIAHDSAPEGIVEVKREDFLVFAEERLYYCGDICRDIRHSVHWESVLVHMPLCAVVPAVETVAGRNVVYIADVESLVLLRVIRKAQVQLIHESHASAHVGAVAVAEQSERRELEIVLYHLTAELVLQALPHLAELLIDRVELLLRVAVVFVVYVREHLYIAVCCMDIYDIRLELCKLLGREHRVIAVLSVFARPELRLKAVVEQEKLQHVPHRVHGGTAEYCDALLYAARAVFEKLTLQALLLSHYLRRIERVFKYSVHNTPPKN